MPIQFSKYGRRSGARPRVSAGVAQLVERQPSKLNVASSSLVSRSVLLVPGRPNPGTGSLLVPGRPNPGTGSLFVPGRPNPGTVDALVPGRSSLGTTTIAHLAQLVEHVLGK